jgi:hypothetical protein
MIRRENDCVGCEHCLNCGKKDAIHLYCDKCGENVDELYITDEGQVCFDCLIEMFTCIDETNAEQYEEE